MWYSDLAGTRQGREGCETVRKPEGLGKDPREGVPVPSQKGNALSSRMLKRLLGEKDMLKPEPSYPFTLLLWSATVARKPK
jgi:hypothetical protein